MLEEMINSGLSDEGANEFYNHSKGGYGLPFAEGLLHQKRGYFEAATGLKLMPQNSYSRIYEDGNKMAVHTDREGLDLTVSVCVLRGFENRLCVIAHGGQAQCFDVLQGDAVLLKGRELRHYREEIKAEKGRKLFFVFLHYSVL